MIYLAPLEGLTTLVFRNAINSIYGGIDKYYTPFLTVTHLKGKHLREVAPENNIGMKVVPQILGNRPGEFIKLAQELKRLGYEEVNLNLGCPSGTVVKKGRGSGFLSFPEELRKYLDEIFEKTDINISIKTRIGMNSTEDLPKILDVYKDFPISELTVHPRLGIDMYRGSTNLCAFKEMNQECLLGIGNIREECADTIRAEPTYITKHATNAKQTYCVTSTKQSQLERILPCFS